MQGYNNYFYCVYTKACVYKPKLRRSKQCHTEMALLTPGEFFLALIPHSVTDKKNTAA